MTSSNDKEKQDLINNNIDETTFKMCTTKSLQPNQENVEKADSSDRISMNSTVTKDSTQELKQYECRGKRRRHRFTSLFSLQSRKRASSPLSPPKRWSIHSLFLRQRAIPRRKSFSTKTPRGFSTASLELDLHGSSKRGLDLYSSSTSFTSTGPMDIVETSKSEGFLGYG